MASTQYSSYTTIDPISGYCTSTKTYHSLRTPAPVPPLTIPVAVSDYVLSLLHISRHFNLDSPLLIDSASGSSLSYSSFLSKVDSLSSSLPPIPAHRVALILSPCSFHVPVLYFSLLSLNVIVSPANPLSTASELAHLVSLSNPYVIFTVSSLLSKLPSTSSAHVILLDSPEFTSMLTSSTRSFRAAVSQEDTAVIMYSSGTTGRVKGVELTHRNLIALIADDYHQHQEKDESTRATRPISLVPVPLFHVYGFTMLLRSIALSETLVVTMERFDFEKMLAAVERCKVTYMPVSPPLVVAMTKSELVKKYDISSLTELIVGGASLNKQVVEKFKACFPDIEIVQGYGLTETSGGVALTIGPDECGRYGSVGRLKEFLKAKIIDPLTGEALPPGKQGELWLHGPTITKGYVGDKEATAATFTPKGWLKTGDLCYFDDVGCLYIVDRIKELIKYKGYQVPPAELEYLLLSHPDISDAAVIPYPDEEVGEIPMAFVVRKPGGQISMYQVMEYIAKQVAPYKKIRRVSFVSAIPKNPTGKILRRELVKLATGDLCKL